MRKVLGGVAMAAVVFLSGCAHERPQAKQAYQAKAQQAARKYVDNELGFEISRPSGQWALSATDEQTMEGVSIPVVMQDRESGAQVVIQVAPAVASPTQFAQRITEGLKTREGFSTSEPAPLQYSDNAVGFDFQMEDRVKGRVAVLTGKSGRVYMMLATWPSAAPASVSANVEQIFQSLRPL